MNAASASTLCEHYAALVAADDNAFTHDDAQFDAAKALDKVIAAAGSRGGFFPFRKNKRAKPKGLYLWGGVGRGKTMLMDMAYDRMKAIGIPAARFHFHDFMADVHDRVHDDRLKKTDDPARQVAKSITGGAKVLCFDEMEVRDIADAMIIARVIEGFFDDGGVLVSTSNRKPDDLYERGLHRERFLPFIALIKKRMDILELASPTDYRRRQLAAMRHWFTGSEAETAPLLEAAWQNLTAGSEARRDIVRVAGREIVMERVAHSLAFTDFGHICGGRFAARDYLAIADRYAGLFVSGIPSMDDAMQNEARRFIWLVDALYDRGRFLVGGSEAAIEALYNGTRWRAEFPRTCSRLTEMTRAIGEAGGGGGGNNPDG